MSKQDITIQYTKKIESSNIIKLTDPNISEVNKINIKNTFTSRCTNEYACVLYYYDIVGSLYSSLILEINVA